MQDPRMNAFNALVPQNIETITVEQDYDRNSLTPWAGPASFGETLMLPQRMVYLYVPPDVYAGQVLFSGQTGPVIPSIVLLFCVAV